MKNSEQIKEAIERLKLNKNKTSQFNGFGEDKHAALDASIETLENELDEATLYDRLDNEEWSQEEFDSANGILEWKNSDDDNLEDHLYPENK